MWKRMYLTLLQGVIKASEIMPACPETEPVQLRLNKAIVEADDLYSAAEDETREKLQF